MSRYRSGHHPYDPDYDRYTTKQNHHHNKRDQSPPAPTIEYQDDSPFNSDDESYLTAKPKKTSYHNPKPTDAGSSSTATNKKITIKLLNPPAPKTDRYASKPDSDPYYHSNKDDYHYEQPAKKAKEDTDLRYQFPKEDTSRYRYTKQEGKEPAEDDQLQNRHHNDAKDARHRSKDAPDPTDERLARLETMFAEFIKQGASPKVADAPKEPYTLEPRDRTFTTSKWIHHIQETSIAHNWSEKNTIQYMVSMMSGFVKAWYNNLPSHNFTWPEYKLLITKIFPDNVDFVTTLKRLVTRLKLADETMMTYYFSKMYLIEACKISGQDAVSCLIDGLNNEAIQEEAKTKGFANPEQLYAGFLLNLPDYTVDYQPPTLSDIPYEVEQGVEAEEEPIDDVEEVEEEQEKKYKKRVRSESSDKSSRKRTVHSRLDKRFIRKDYDGVPLAMVYCSNCNRRGHATELCRRPVMYCVEDAGVESPFVTKCFVRGFGIEGLIDTGSNYVIIKETIAKELGLKVMACRDVIKGVGGAKVDVLGEVTFGLRVDQASAEVCGFVVPDEAIAYALVVGSNFLCHKNVNMSVSNGKICFKKEQR